MLRAKDVALDDAAALGQVVVEQVGTKRSTWSRRNLHAEASRQTMGLRFAAITDREAVIGLVTDAAEAASLRLTPPQLTTSPAGFTRPDGSSVVRPKNAPSTPPLCCCLRRTACKTEPSRAGRDLAMYVQLRAACQRAGVLYLTHGRVYDLSRSDDPFMMGFEFLRAVVS
ncbi:MAG: recombinase family protein, partial [Mycobacteriales bacterium]